MKGEWIRKPQGTGSVVFVHGILSSGEACWRHEDGGYWPELLNRESGTSKELGIYVFTYQTDMFSGDYRLGDIVDSLKEHLRLDGVIESKLIIFVCHSMGGIVVRKFIVERATELIDKKIAIGLFLLSSPSLGSSYANWLSPLSKLVGHTQADALRFQRNNAWLNDLDKEFQNLKEAGKLWMVGKELVEDKFVTLRKFWGKQIVEGFSGARYFGEHYKVPRSDHFSIAKPQDEQAIQHRLLCQFIESIFPTSDPHACALRLSISVHNDTLSLWASNIGTHIIRDIEINAIPDAEDWHKSTHGSLPRVNDLQVRGVEVVYPIMGGWLYAKVAQLSPNRGLQVVSYRVESGDYTTIDFDAFWNDHDGMQRKSHVVADLAVAAGDLLLQSRS